MNQFIKNPFEHCKEVQWQHCVFTAAMLILAGSYSCKNKMSDDEETTEPKKTILGKWKLEKTNNSMNGHNRLIILNTILSMILIQTILY